MKYTAVIKYNGIYYVSHKLGTSKKFKFMSYETDDDLNFKTSNVELRKRIAKELMEKSPFRNTYYTPENSHRAVSLYKTKFLNIKRVAIFVCDTLDDEDKSFNIPYCNAIKHECEDDTNKIAFFLKWIKVIAPLIMYIPYFLIFLYAAFQNGEATFDLDVMAFLGVVFNYIGSFTIGTKWFKKRIGNKFWYSTSKPYWECFTEFIIFLTSFGVAYFLRDIPVDTDRLAKFGLAFLFWDAMARLVRMEQ